MISGPPVKGRWSLGRQGSAVRHSKDQRHSICAVVWFVLGSVVLFRRRNVFEPRHHLVAKGKGFAVGHC